MDVPPKSPLHRLLRVTENPAPLVILPHDNRDPDALASAVTLPLGRGSPGGAWGRAGGAPGHGAAGVEDDAAAVRG